MIGAEPVGWAVFVAGLVGLVGLARTGNRLAAGVILTASGLAVLVARLGETWPTLEVVDAGRVGPVRRGRTRPRPPSWSGAGGRRPSAGRAAVLAVAAFVVALGWGGRAVDPVRAGLGLTVGRSPLGLSADQQDLVRGLRLHTTADARLLVEDADDVGRGGTGPPLSASGSNPRSSAGSTRRRASATLSSACGTGS